MIVSFRIPWLHSWILFDFSLHLLRYISWSSGISRWTELPSVISHAVDKKWRADHCVISRSASVILFFAIYSVKNGITEVGASGRRYRFVFASDVRTIITQFWSSSCSPLHWKLIKLVFYMFFVSFRVLLLIFKNITSRQRARSEWFPPCITKPCAVNVLWWWQEWWGWWWLWWWAVERD